MMKSMLIQLVLILACTLGAVTSHGQDAPGASIKRLRTPDDYKPRTLKEIAAASYAESSGAGDAAEVLLSDLLPSRLRVTYRGSARPLAKSKKDLLQHWTQRYADVPVTYTVPYVTELLFSEGGMDFWLAVNKEILPRFEAEVKEGEPINLNVIRLGGVRTEGKWEWVLLVESFAKTTTVSH